MRRRFSLRACCALVGLLVPLTVHGANKTWTAAVSGDFGDAANWTGGVPTPADTATFNVAGTYTVTFDNSPNPLANPVLNQDLFFSAGAVTFTSGSDGPYTYQLTGAGGDDANITGGTLTLGTSGNPLHLTADDLLLVRGGATLNVTSGSTVNSRNANVASVSGGGSGTLVVDGTGSSVTATATISTWGIGNTATVTFQNNATGNFSTIRVAESATVGTIGIVDIQSGAELTLSTLNLAVLGGVASGASLTVDGAGSTVTHTPGSQSSLSIGHAVNGTALLNINNGGLYDAGAAATTLENTGTINLDGGTFRVGAFIDSGGIFNFISGTLGFAGNLHVDGTGLLGKLFGANPTLAAGRTVAVSETTTIAHLHTLTLNGGTFNTGDLEVQGTLVLNSGGTLGIASGGLVRVEGGGVIDAAASISGSIVGNDTGSTINVNATSISLGNSASFAGFNHEGTLNVGANTVTLNSAGYARLGALTSLAGGTINAPNSVYLPGGGNILGNGAVSARVAADLGSVIEADGALALGDAASPAGFFSSGELRTRQFAVTLNCSGAATLGNLTTLGSGPNAGSLNATNGLVVDFGRAITGFGTINSTNTLAQRTIINGLAQGNSMAQPLTFTGYVKGVGTFDNVTFAGTYDPGLSPTLATVGSITFGATNLLIMELGGTDRGSEYDAIIASGTLGLGGTLRVTLLGGFNPAAGDWFDLFDWATLAGMFTTLQLPTLGAGLAWDTSQLDVSGVLNVVPILSGDYNDDGTVDAADYVVWRKNEGTMNMLPNDPIGGMIGPAQFYQWRANFGNTTGSDAGGFDSSKSLIPEPASVALLFWGLLGLRTLARRR